MKVKYLQVLLIALILPLLASGQSETYSIKKARLSSNSSDEFSPVYYQNGIVFCSNMTRSLVRNYL
ncbi:MAG: hypothetical protein RBS38_03930, partial [Bacteroidales bacterium]|nr:hypothetical protein [Bacteroidales bacterium]